MKYGVIDLGSNTIRLCVYDISGATYKIKTLLNRKNVVGLASYIQDGVLSQAGIDIALATLNKQLKRARIFNPDRLDVFATAVLRNISNSEAVVKYLSEETGVSINLLSGYDEAHLGFIGASFGDPLNEGLLVDIGGGSTEMTYIEHARDLWNVSVGEGCLSVYERFIDDVLPTPEEQHDVHTFFAASLTDCVRDTSITSDILYGVGGSIRALGKVNAALQPSRNEKVIEASDLAFLFDCLHNDRKRFINAVVRAAPERLHTISCGLCIIDEIFKETGARTLRICKYGVREGYVLDRMLNYSVHV